MTGDIGEMEVKVLEKHHPAGLTVRQFLWLSEIRQILVVGEEGDWVMSALEGVMPVV